MPSTTNLLQAVNRVLLDIGERQVTSFTSPAARKAKAYLQDAFNDLQMFHQWEWLYGTTVLQNWVENKAEILNARRIRNLLYNTGTYRYPISYVDRITFDKYHSLSGTSFLDTDTSTRPRFFTIENESQVRLTPYPSQTLNRAKVEADIIWYLQPPNDETDLFPIPERFMTPLYKRACYQMAIRHLGDANLASAFQAEFEQAVNQFRSQENKVPTTGTNMYSRSVY